MTFARSPDRVQVALPLLDLHEHKLEWEELMAEVAHLRRIRALVALGGIPVHLASPIKSVVRGHEALDRPATLGTQNGR